MVETDVHPRVIFPEGFDARAEEEMPEKGWIGAEIELPGGCAYAVRFIDTANLLHDLKVALEGTGRCFAEPGLVVLPEVTVDAIRAAALRLWESGTFDDLAPSVTGAVGRGDSPGNSDADPAIGEYSALGPSTFRVVEALEVRQLGEAGSWECSLEVRLRSVDHRESRRLTLSFGGVLGLRLAPPTCMVVQYLSLDVRSIRGRGWGAANYAVRDTLKGSLSFLCRDLRASVS